VLFDGRHQKTLTKVIAIIAIIAFLGFGLVAGFLAVSGGCGVADPLAQAVSDAQTSVQQGQAAVATARKAVAQSPGSAQAKKDLAQARSDLGQAQITLAQAFAYWGQVAEQAGQRSQAVLAYQRFLQLAPDDTLAADIRNRLAELAKPVTTTG
jgi:tetratricopeptide (TPR) repeat protein